ncbi:MAG: hypothetical protein EOT04_02995 [Candidatus Chaera renei]|uniref:Uncharacterized protein n=1 Tax=Candidatus Chaera renei TaxID=2506947 RepID=A0A4Q0AG24_9BACT|nr:MAG: hypothetical protein EOT04_02995 [Candidatus Chaera renei]
MVKTKKTTRRVKRLFNSDLFATLTSLSYLGSLWRAAVAAAVYLSLILLNELYALYYGPQWGVNGGLLQQTFFFQSALTALLVVVWAVLVYDLLFVVICRRYPLNQRLDRLVLIGLEAVFAAVALLSVAFASASSPMNLDGFMFWFFALLLVVPPLRAVAGVSAVAARRR